MLGVLLLLASLATFAGDPKKAAAKEVAKEVILENAYKNISVAESMNVVFVSDASSTLNVKGEQKFVDNVSLTVVNGTLFVSLPEKLKNLKGTVYIPVRPNLNQIDVAANAKVNSKGFLNCRNLTVFIGDGAYAHLKNRGTMQIKPAEHTQLEFEKYEEIKE